ncbi:MAG: hypothetical protein LBC20_06075 [Planctomycetaceae bacterium]|nr:hypothetical protein [Planctomycetaceae bacterium]
MYFNEITGNNARAKNYNRLSEAVMREKVLRRYYTVITAPPLQHKE